MEIGDSRLVLTCEYLEQPLGVQNEKPRFAWRVEGGLEFSRQRSARLVVWDGAELMWDSGTMNSPQSSAVEYEGAPLKSRRQYRWEVEVEIALCQNPLKTETDPTVDAGDGGTNRVLLKGTSFFETGIFRQEEWQGGWLAPAEERKGAAPLIRKAFELEQLPGKARLYVSGLGYCEAFVNGQKVDGSRLDPGWTDYQKTVLYRVFDVGSYLKTGRNVLCFELGEGWQGLEHAFFEKVIGTLPSWNSRPRLLCNLYLDEECIASGHEDGWLYSWGRCWTITFMTGRSTMPGRRSRAGRSRNMRQIRRPGNGSL